MKSHELKLLQQQNQLLQAVSFKNYRTLLREICRTYAAFPATQEISRFVRQNDWTGLVAFAGSLTKQQYVSSTEHFVHNQLANLIRKYPFPEGLVESDPEGEALKKFWASEHKTRRINQRFACFDTCRSPRESELAKARSWIQYVLGVEPDLASILERCNFGPGASLGVHGNATNLARKLLAQRWSVTPQALQLSLGGLIQWPQVHEILSERAVACFDRLEFQRNAMKRLKIVEHNNISFVPKDVTVLRTVATEPLLNGFVQKGIDLHMRDKLRRVGIDLSDQGKNMEYAKLGSIANADPDGFVTIDLSSASDSIATGLVKNLLPDDWFSLLDDTRSKNFKLKNRLYAYNKFCSMGNGFCFPLETLIFASICHAVGCGRPGTDFLVYGDDIIVRQRYAAQVLDLLRYCGFSANPKKTFLEGPFRESCGADWFEGKDVRPFIFDFALDTVQNVFKFLNLSRRNESTSLFFSEVRPFLLGLIPNFQYLRPQKGNADSGIDAELDEFMASPNAFWRPRIKPTHKSYCVEVTSEGEYRVVPSGIPKEHIYGNHFAWGWKELIQTAAPDKPVRRLGKYEIVLMIGALSGVDSRNPFTERRNTCTKVALTSRSETTFSGSLPPDQLWWAERRIGRRVRITLD